MSVDTGWKLPTTEPYPSTNTGVWVNPTNAYTSDGTFTTTDQYVYPQDYGTFGFSIPTGSTILGIEVIIQGKVSADTGLMYVSLCGSMYTTYTPHATLTTTNTSYTIGSPSNLWGRTWVASDFDDSNFYTELLYGSPSNTAYVDSIQIRVTYTETPSVVGPFPTFFRAIIPIAR